MLRLQKLKRLASLLYYQDTQSKHHTVQVKSSASDEELEEALDFQLEELTVMARKEMELVARMAEWRPWEAPEVTAVDTSLLPPACASSSF